MLQKKFNMLVNHINTDPYTMNEQKKVLMQAWTKFKKFMDAATKREYKKRLWTIKHLEDNSCPIEHGKYFIDDTILSGIEQALF